MSVQMRRSYRKAGSTTVAMFDVVYNVNNFLDDHPNLWPFIRRVAHGKVPIEADWTIEMFEEVEDAHIKEAWVKARYVVENLACLYAAEALTSWGCGYRSDDGFDYLTAAIDNASFLCDIDLTEEDFRKWWDAVPFDTRDSGPMLDYPRDVFGATDGEIRYILFPVRCKEAEAAL